VDGELLLVRRGLLALVVLASFAALVLASAVGVEEAAIADDWESAEGFALDRIVGGLELPSAVVVADTPLGTRYLVTELGGTIKSITSDGQVIVFATVDTVESPNEYPDLRGEAGLAGICLDAEIGYVFVTYTRRDSDGILRNTIRRFDLGPDGIASQPLTGVDISGALGQFGSSVSHQIGACQADSSVLFVSVGDAHDFSASRERDILLGKVLRVNYNGTPVEDNPFSDDPSSTEAYVWAYGLRNPFGMELIDGQVYVTNNGVRVDSLLRIEPGVDYLWDGTDESMALNALYVWVPSVAPVHLEYVDTSTGQLPENWRGGFYVGTSASTIAGVQFVPYDPVSGRVTGPPRWVVRQLGGPKRQAVAGVAVDGDGVVFAPLLPGSDGDVALYRLRFDPANQLPNTIGASPDGASPLNDFGCLACHQYDGEGGSVGPPLDKSPLTNRLESTIFSKEYEGSIRDLDQLDEGPWADFKAARGEVLSASGEDRMLAWIKYRIMEPRFDRIDAQMPTLGVSEGDAEALADFLLGDSMPWWRRQAIEIFGSRASAAWFMVGGVVATLGLLAAYLLVRFVPWRRWLRRSE